MTPLSLTDLEIREAFSRRAQVAVPVDLRHAIRAAVLTEPQRWSWAARATAAFPASQRRQTLVVLAAAALLVATALAIALIASHEQNPMVPGRGLAFVSDGDLWVADAAAENPRLVLDMGGDAIVSRPTWVDLRTLLIQDAEGGVYAVDMRTAGSRLLSPDGGLLAISPDHSRVALGLDRLDGPHIAILNIANGRVLTDLAVRPLAVPPADPLIGPDGARTGGPHAWSPDGSWLLGQGMDTDQSATSGWIYRVDVETGEIHDLATGLCCGLNFANPMLMPDGRMVVYVDYHPVAKGELCDFRCGTLWALDSVTGERARLTAEAGSEIAPAISPDGAWIAFAEYLGPGYDLSIVRSDGTGRHKLTNTGDVHVPGSDMEPYVSLVWDADASGVTFMRGAFDQTDWPLWHVTSNGQQLQRLGAITVSEFVR